MPPIAPAAITPKAAVPIAAITPTAFKDASGIAITAATAAAVMPRAGLLSRKRTTKT